MTTIKIVFVSIFQWVASRAKALASGRQPDEAAQLQCKDCNPCPNCGRRKVGSAKDLYQGYWSHITFSDSAEAAGADNEYQPERYLGVVSEEDR